MITSEIIRDTIHEEARERALCRDEVTGFRIVVAKVVDYLKQLIICISCLTPTVLLLCIGTVMLWNFFAPTSKDVSDRVINNFLSALNLQTLPGLLAEGDSRRYSSTCTIPPHANTQE